MISHQQQQQHSQSRHERAFAEAEIRESNHLATLSRGGQLRHALLYDRVTRGARVRRTLVAWATGEYRRVRKPLNTFCSSPAPASRPTHAHKSVKLENQIMSQMEGGARLADA